MFEIVAPRLKGEFDEPMTATDEGLKNLSMENSLNVMGPVPAPGRRTKCIYKFKSHDFNFN